MKKNSDKLSDYMFQIFDPFNQSFLTKLLEIRLKQLKDPKRQLEEEELTYLHGTLARIRKNALFRKENNIPDRYYNSMFGVKTENMHIFLSKHQLNNYWKKYMDFNSEQGPNIAKELDIIHALAHAIEYAIDDHDYEGQVPIPQTAVYPRTGEKAWQEFFSLFEVFNTKNNKDGMNTNDLMNDRGSIIDDICKNKPTFRNEVYLVCYSNFIISGNGYLEVGTGGNNLVSEEGKVIATVNDNILREILDKDCAMDPTTKISIVLRSKRPNALISNPTVISSNTVANNTQQNTPKKKKSREFAVGPMIYLDPNSKGKYEFYNKRDDATEDFLQRANESNYNATTLREDMSHFLRTGTPGNRLRKIFTAANINPDNVYILPTDSSTKSHLVNPKKVLTKEITSRHGIIVQELIEKVKGISCKTFIVNVCNYLDTWL